MSADTSSQAKRNQLLKEGKLAEAERWTTISLAAFEKFELENPTWYNKSFFAATALAILGRYEEAMATFPAWKRRRETAQ